MYKPPGALYSENCPQIQSKTKQKRSENLKVIYIKLSLFYALINHKFKTSELKNVGKVGKANSSSLKLLFEQTGNVHFCTICESIFLVRGP